MVLHVPVSFRKKIQAIAFLWLENQFVALTAKKEAQLLRKELVDMSETLTAILLHQLLMVCKEILQNAHPHGLRCMPQTVDIIPDSGDLR